MNLILTAGPCQLYLTVDGLHYNWMNSVSVTHFSAFHESYSKKFSKTILSKPLYFAITVPKIPSKREHILGLFFEFCLSDMRLRSRLFLGIWKFFNFLTVQDRTKRTTASLFSTPKPPEICHRNLGNVFLSTRKFQKTVEKSPKSALFQANSPKQTFLRIFWVIPCLKALSKLITNIYVSRPD